MPRIDAPTIAQHNERRRQQVIEAAAAVLRERGADHVTVGEVARRSGLARSSVYGHFDSSAALVAVAIEADFTRARDEIAGALTGVRDPRERLDRFIAALLGAGHVPLGSAALDRADDACRARIAALHRELTAPLTETLTELGAADPAETGELVMGVLGAAVTRIDRGADLPATVAAAQRFIGAALGAAQ